jgi:hypothetical protein
MLGFGMCSCEIKYKFYGQPQLPSNYQVLAWLVFVNVVILISCRIVIPIVVRSASELPSIECKYFEVSRELAYIYFTS